MPKTIVYNDIKIIDWTVDVEGQYVSIRYQILNDLGEFAEASHAIFWVTMPEDGFTLPDGSIYTNPDNYFLLPPAYVQTLLDLTNDARAAIANRFINGLP